MKFNIKSTLFIFIAVFTVFMNSAETARAAACSNPNQDSSLCVSTNAIAFTGENDSWNPNLNVYKLEARAEYKLNVSDYANNYIHPGNAISFSVDKQIRHNSQGNLSLNNNAISPVSSSTGNPAGYFCSNDCNAANGEASSFSVSTAMENGNNPGTYTLNSYVNATTPTITYSSSNSSVLNCTNSGTCQASGVGTATVTVTIPQSSVSVWLVRNDPNNTIGYNGSLWDNGNTSGTTSGTFDSQTISFNVTVVAAPTQAPTGTISADPNPPTLNNNNSNYNTIIRWEARNTQHVRICVSSQPDCTNNFFADDLTPSEGDASANWIAPGQSYTFSLWDYTTSTFLHSVTVTGPSAPGQPSLIICDGTSPASNFTLSQGVSKSLSAKYSTNGSVGCGQYDGIDVTNQATWTSSNTTSASVSNNGTSNGLVRVVSAGNSTITATYNSVNDTVGVTVTGGGGGGNSLSCTLAPNPLTIPIGQIGNINWSTEGNPSCAVLGCGNNNGSNGTWFNWVTEVPVIQNGSPASGSRTVSYGNDPSSLNQTCTMKIYANAGCQGNPNATCTSSLNFSGGGTREKQFRVCPRLAAIDGIGNTFQFRAYFNDNNGNTDVLNLDCDNGFATAVGTVEVTNDHDGRGKDISWGVFGQNIIASIDQAGLATLTSVPFPNGDMRNQSTISARYSTPVGNNFESFSDESTLKGTNSIPTPSFIICPGPMTLDEGGNGSFTAHFSASGGLTCNSTSPTTNVTNAADWTSDNNTYISVDGGTNGGFVRALVNSAGKSAIITAQYWDNYTNTIYSDTETVTVNTPVYSLKVCPDDVTLTSSSGTINFTAHLSSVASVPAICTNSDVTNRVAWSVVPDGTAPTTSLGNGRFSVINAVNNSSATVKATYSAGPATYTTDTAEINVSLTSGFVKRCDGNNCLLEPCVGNGCVGGDSCTSNDDCSVTIPTRSTVKWKEVVPQ